jgi:hypothetical protein
VVMSSVGSDVIMGSRSGQTTELADEGVGRATDVGRSHRSLTVL